MCNCVVVAQPFSRQLSDGGADTSHKKPLGPRGCRERLSASVVLKPPPAAAGRQTWQVTSTYGSGGMGDGVEAGFWPKL